VWRKAALESLHDMIGGRIERVALLPPSEPERGAIGQFVGGYLVADHFLRTGHGPADGAAHALEDRLHVFGVGRKMYSSTDLKSILAVVFLIWPPPVRGAEIQSRNR